MSNKEFQLFMQLTFEQATNKLLQARCEMLESIIKLNNIGQQNEKEVNSYDKKK